MTKELTPLEVSKQLKDFVLEFVKNGLDRMFIHGSFDIIESTLKKYEELTSKPVMLYGRTHGHTQALVDSICKNYKEIKITNIEDEKKLKALDIIKRNPLMVCTDFYKCIVELKLTYQEYLEYLPAEEDRAIKTQEEYELLKEVLCE